MVTFDPRAAKLEVSSIFAALLLVLIALLGGCAGPQEKADERKIQTLWPEPPERPRYRFVTFLRSLSDIRAEDEDERLQRVLTGRSAREERIYGSPADVAARNGRIYIADPLQNAIVVFDVPRRKVFRFGVREPNRLQRPAALAIDGLGRVYVLDSQAKKVMVFDGLGLYQSEFRLEEDFAKPVGIAVDPAGERIYVVDRGSLNGDDHKVVVFGPSGERKLVLGSRGEGPGEFSIPLTAEVGPDGALVVLDAGNFRVQIFDREGTFVRQFGSAGNGLGQFSRPRGLAVDGEGRIYVSDANFNNLQIFDWDGQLLMTIGRPDPRGAPGEFSLIGQLAADASGYLYVADLFFRKVEVYDHLSDAQAARYMPAR